MRPPKTPPPPQVDFFVGLDLAQAADFSAWAVVERTRTQPPAGEGKRVPARVTYAVRDLRRWPLRTPYTRIVDDVCRLVGADLPAAARSPGGATGAPRRGITTASDGRSPGGAPVGRPVLVVDATGVGAAVVDLFRAARNRGELKAQMVAVLITAGHATTPGDFAVNVPKKALVSILQVLLQAGRLKIADLPEREVLVKELDNFQVRITVAANETFGAWRESVHDDLVLAVALACWRGESGPTFEAPPADAAVPVPAPLSLAERRDRDGSPWARLHGRRPGRRPW